MVDTRTLTWQSGHNSFAEHNNYITVESQEKLLLPQI